ncbi:MAG: hypothetical protein P0S94_01335 [Simkaniaceae bacterium]|nr:hypothetical protein [Simkaniaceae bacterium]
MDRREYVRLAVERGRAFQSKATGLVHNGDRISVYENICFAKALIASKIVDNVLEGRKILERMEGFRKKDMYPYFLHEYPNCKNALRLEPNFDGIWCEDLGVRLDGNRQEKGAPALTLFDFEMARRTGLYSKRLLKSHPAHLELALLEGDFAKAQEIKPAFVKYENRYFWGTADCIHSAYLDDEAIYFDAHKDVEICVNEQKASCFAPNDLVTVKSGDAIFTISFTGDVCGHIHKGNRKGQCDKDQFKAHDWKIFVRSFGRPFERHVDVRHLQGIPCVDKRCPIATGM